MSILDFAENPDYQIVAVALAATDAVVLFSTKKEKLRPVLEMAIQMLESELEKLPPSNPDPLTSNKTATSKESYNEPAANET